MKRNLTIILSIVILAICMSACGWKPTVEAAALTAPWTQLNLPVKENAVVWKSEPNEFRAVHKEDKKTVTKNYTDALKAQGWATGKFDEVGDRWYVEMTKGAEKINLEFYDFENTGVVITKDGGSSSTTSTEKTIDTTKTDATGGTTNGGKKPERADFTMSSEEFDKAFTTKGVTDKDLQKYASKIIEVTGRVSLLSMEKKGTVQPWVTLFAPGLGNGVSCYFDDDNLEQMKQLRMDKTVTVQGFQDDFLVPEVSPRLEHCVVVKAD